MEEHKIDFLSLCIVGKGAKERKQACLESGLPKCNLATLVRMRFTSKVVMFQQCLTYKTAIIMCYGCQIKALANIITQKQLLKQFVMFFPL
jgi:hypothetical protein